MQELYYAGEPYQGRATRVFAYYAEAAKFDGKLPAMVLVHGGGHSTKEIPINHRARVAGVSKYGVFNRLGRGIYDLIAIAWYQRRRVHRQAIVEE